MHGSKWFLVPVICVGLVAAACGGDGGSEAGTGDGARISGFVNISGSSTVEPISTRMAELYNDEVSDDVEITVNGPGTSAGFREFCPGNTDINDASRPIRESEAAACVDHVELRVAFDGIAVMVHPSNPLECVTVADLYAISGPESEGNTWAEAAALAAELGSGTYGSYVEIVLEGPAEERAEAGAYAPQQDENGDDIFIRTDYAGQPDDNVVIEGISSTRGAYGWVGFAFAQAAGDSVKILDVRDEATGACVAPSLETIADGSYPVSRSLYIYVNTARAATNPALVDFVDYYLGDGYPNGVANAFAEGVGYVALPADLKAETDAAWAAAKP